jgi:hypothetical protein
MSVQSFRLRSEGASAIVMLWKAQRPLCKLIHDYEIRQARKTPKTNGQSKNGENF